MSTPLQVVRNLAMNFGGVVAVHNVSFDLQEGELLCIIGPNGAGKTTLINLLSGALRPVSGSIIFAGQEIIGLPLYRYAHLGIVRKFQVPSIFQSMTPRDNSGGGAIGRREAGWETKYG